MPEPLSPAERSLRARLAAHQSWALTTDPAARTRPGTDAFLARFEKQVDPEGTLPEAERRRRAESAKKAYMTALAYKSSRARKGATP
jgi:hypothetical protein